MAGYSEGIVATRKLNKRNKARLRATGDTEFGFIKGRLSHINKDEKAQLTAADAYDISLRERVESDIADKGAGTINPFTGMPEYHYITPTNVVGKSKQRKKDQRHNSKHSSGTINDDHSPSTGAYVAGIGQEGLDQAAGAVGMTADEYTEKLGEFNVGVDDLQYLTEFDQEPFDFIERGTQLEIDQLKSTKKLAFEGVELQGRGIDLGERKLGAGRDLSLEGTGLGRRKLESGRDLSLEGIELGREKLTSSRDIALGALGSQQKSLGRSMTRGYGQATGAAASAASRSGLATSGTITQGLERQKQQLFQDYTAGTEDISRQRTDVLAGHQLGLKGLGLEQKGIEAGYGFGVEGFDLEEKGIKSDYGFGMEQFGLGRDALDVERKSIYANYGFGKRAAELGEEQSIYGQQKINLEQLYGDFENLGLVQ